MAFAKLTLFGRMADQHISNIFWYNSDELTFDPATEGEALVTAFLGDVMPAIQDLQHAQYENVGIRVEAPGSVEWYQEDWTLQGTSTISGGMSPSFVAYGFQLVRSSGATKSGAKRFCGVPNNAIDPDQPLVPNNATEISAAAAALALPIVTGGGTGVTFTPVIVRLDDETGAVEAFSVVISARFRKFTTQNSRKTRAN